jgi:hypothetical protein
VVGRVHEPPAVSGVRIDDGTAQRSAVRSIAVTFSTLVSFDPGAFELTRQGGGGVVPTVTTAVVNGATVATLTFGGVGTESGSLTDGNWTLRVIASRVRATANPQTTMVADQATTFHRLFGDSDGNRGVDTLDLFRLYGAFGKSAAEAGFLAYLDADGNGSVDTLDLFRFYSRFGSILNP